MQLYSKASLYLNQDRIPVKWRNIQPDGPDSYSSTTPGSWVSLWSLSNQLYILNITHFTNEELFLTLLMLLNKPSDIDFSNNMWSSYLGEYIKVLALSSHIQRRGTYRENCLLRFLLLPLPPFLSKFYSPLNAQFDSPLYWTISRFISSIFLCRNSYDGMYKHWNWHTMCIVFFGM